MPEASWLSNGSFSACHYSPFYPFFSACHFASAVFYDLPISAAFIIPARHCADAGLPILHTENMAYCCPLCREARFSSFFQRSHCPGARFVGLNLHRDPARRPGGRRKKRRRVGNSPTKGSSLRPGTGFPLLPCFHHMTEPQKSKHRKFKLTFIHSRPEIAYINACNIYKARLNRAFSLYAQNAFKIHLIGMNNYRGKYKFTNMQ